MNEYGIPAVLVLAAVLLFPPADRVVVIGTNECRVSEGFTFIKNIGGPVVIRYPQWIVELVVVGAVATFVVLMTRPAKK
jgi:hypothetical protein